MTETVEDPVALMELERLELDLFRGIGSGGETSVRIFGGHVVAQTLAAAYHTVETRLCHSLHAYFMRPGDPSIPVVYSVVYSVDRARDGGSFTTRRVIALQHGKQILNLSASFHISEEGWQHQHAMPKVAGPDGLTERHVLRQRNVDTLPKQYRKDYVRPRPIEVRELAPTNHCDPNPAPDLNHLWFRMRRAASQTPQVQHCLLAYASAYEPPWLIIATAWFDMVQRRGHDRQSGSCDLVSCTGSI